MTDVSLVFVCLFVGVQAYAAEGDQNTNVTPPSTDDGIAWTLSTKFSDEFNGKAIDTGKWDAGIPSWTPYLSWSSDALSEHDGKLYIAMSYAPHKGSHGQTIYYKSGLLRTRDTVEYGYFQARIRAAPRFPGVSSAFWASPTVKNGKVWTEIDFLETGQRYRKNPRIEDFTLHVFQFPGVATLESRITKFHTWQAPWSPSSEFHVYGCEWTPKKITWYVDGKRILTRANSYWHQPLNISLSLGLRPPLRENPSSSGFPTTMEVDYIRVWTAKKMQSE